MSKAVDIAKWFIKGDVPGLDNSLDGNMKINKLLYFAQLISLIEKSEPLFEDEMFAFEHGVVVENVRYEYRNNYYNLCESAFNSELKFNNIDESILNMTKGIFGDVSAKELSELTHQHKAWKSLYKNPNENGWHDKFKSKIDINRFFDDYLEDLNTVRNILKAYKGTQHDNIEEKCICVNDVKFYYNPSQISIDEHLINKLKNLSADEGAYTIYKDEKQGVIIY